MFQLILDTSGDGTTVTSNLNMTAPLLVLGLFAALVVAFVVWKIWRALHRPELFGLERQKIQETWQQIESLSGNGIMGAKLAVIEADKLLDNVLKALYLPGETLGERLKAAAYKYPKIRQVWGAHRLRNQLVHDSAFEISIRQAKSALADYLAALKTVNVL